MNTNKHKNNLKKYHYNETIILDVIISSNSKSKAIKEIQSAFNKSFFNMTPLSMINENINDCTFKFHKVKVKKLKTN